MGQLPILEELAVIAGLGVVITLILARLKLPTVAGLLAAGAVIGPPGLGWVRDLSAIEMLAEVGVVLLLLVPRALHRSSGFRLYLGRLSGEWWSQTPSTDTARWERCFRCAMPS